MNTAPHPQTQETWEDTIERNCSIMVPSTLCALRGGSQQGPQAGAATSANPRLREGPVHPGPSQVLRL